MEPIRTREELEALCDHHVNMLWLMFKGTRRAVKCPRRRPYCHRGTFHSQKAIEYMKEKRRLRQRARTRAKTCGRPLKFVTEFQGPVCVLSRGECGAVRQAAGG